MNYYDLPEWAGWLASIREQPDDDHRRLFCADWLDELETDEARQRAEFIRCQVRADSLRMRGCPSVFLPDEPNGPDDLAECRKRANALVKRHAHRWLGVPSQFVSIPGATASRFANQEQAAAAPHMHFSRGFVTRVSAPLAVLSGGECECMRPTQLPAGLRFEPLYPSRGCKSCHGTGRTPGVLGELLRREPITAAGIEVTDANPYPHTREQYLWSTSSEGLGPGSHWLPPAVFVSHAGGNLSTPGERMAARGSTTQHRIYSTPDAARLALGEALYRLHGPKSEVTT